MINNKKEPREFWIRFRIGNNYSTHQITDVSMNPLGDNPEAFHVIEYSAYMEAQAKIKNLNEILSEYRGMATTGIWIEDQKYVDTLAALLRATSGLEKILMEVETSTLASKIAFETLGDVLKLRRNFIGPQERT